MKASGMLEDGILASDEAVVMTGEPVEDDLQRAMVEGFLTMYTMKSNGEMLVPSSTTDLDLLHPDNQGNDFTAVHILVCNKKAMQIFSGRVQLSSSICTVTTTEDI